MSSLFDIGIILFSAFYLLFHRRRLQNSRAVIIQEDKPTNFISGPGMLFTLVKASSRESIQTMKSLRDFSHKKVLREFRQKRASIVEAEGYEKNDFAFKSEVCSYNRWLIAHDYARNILLDRDYTGLMVLLLV